MHCDIVKDLLPLYAEGMASQESRKLVEAHLKDCPECAKALEELQKDLPAGQQTTLPLEKISRGIRRRRLRTVLMVMALLLALATATFSFIITPRHVPYQEGLLSVREIKVKDLLEGQVTQEKLDLLAQTGLLEQAVLSTIQPGDETGLKAALQERWDRGKQMPDTLLEITVPSGYTASVFSKPDMDPEAWERGIHIFDLELYTYRYEREGARGELKIVLDVEKGKKAALYYVEPGQVNRLVYGPNPIQDGGMITLPRLALSYYLMLAAVLAGALGLLALVFRKREKARRWLLSLLGLPMAWMLAHVMIKGISSVSWHMLQDFWFILVTAGFLFLAWLLFLARRREKRLESA